MKKNIKNTLKQLFKVNPDETLDNSHVVYILTAYSLIGLLIHPLFCITYLLANYYFLSLMEFIYLLILIFALSVREKISVNKFSLLVIVSTTVFAMIQLLFVKWSFGYSSYILLLTPFFIYQQYKNKLFKYLLIAYMLVAYMAYFVYAIHYGTFIKDFPMYIEIIIGYGNLLKLALGIYFYMYLTKQTTDNVINNLSKANDLMDKESKIDHLTGLYNRRSMDKFLNILVEQYKITNKTFGMILLDIDFFKKVNDTYGHLSGDRVLTEISRLVVYTLRKSDSVFRYGGEEFLAIIPGVQTRKEAIDIANEIREDVEKLNIDIGGKDINVTISCGVTLYDGLDMHDNIQRVDDALYKSKNNGRNRAEFL